MENENVQDEQSHEPKKEDYEEPTLLDTEDLEDVSGGCGVCITGGSSET